MEKKASVKNKTIEIIILFITGFFGFSSMPKYVFSFINMPFFFIEIFFIPFIVFYNSEIKKRINIFNNITIGFALVFISVILSVALGVINTNGDFINVITVSRSFFYIVIIAYYVSKIDYIPIDKICLVSFAAILGEFVYGQLTPGIDVRSWIYVNVVALPLFIITSIVLNKKLLIIFSIVCCFVVAILSGYRINIILSFVAIILGVSWIIKRSNATGKTLFFFSILFVYKFIISLFQWLVEKIPSFFNVSDIALYRITERLNDLMNLNIASTDEARLVLLQLLKSRFVEQIIPRGLVGKSISLQEFGIYTDVPLLFYYDVFGSIGAVVFLLIVFYFGFKSFIKAYSKNANLYEVVCGLMFPIFITLTIVNGTYLTFIHVSLISSIIIGNWFHKR